MKKGFTLIELLAVIVILAIIALIAVPIVLNIIESSKESSRLRSLELYISSVDTALSKKSLTDNIRNATCEIQNDGSLLCTEQLSSGQTREVAVEVEFNGVFPTSGTIVIQNGKIVDVQDLLIDEYLYGYNENNVIAKLEGYKVTFNTMGGTEIKSVYLNHGEKITIPNNPQKHGYKFKEWLLDNEVYDFNTPITHSITLTASYEETELYTLMTGQDFNKAVKALVKGSTVSSSSSYDTNVEYIEFYSNGELPSGYTLQTLQALTSTVVSATGETIKAYYNSSNKSVYIYSEGEIVWNDNSNYMFSAFMKLISFKVPYNVTSIGEGAFSACWSLISVTIPDSVESIGNYAFAHCESLTSVTIPNGITSIGNSTFSDCLSLTSVTIPNSVTSIGDSAFQNCSSLTSIIIPNSVTSIGDYAFEGCGSLTSVTIPNGVTSIGDGAFEGCGSLTSVTIPNSVTSIGGAAFYYCSSLTSITIPKNVTSIGNYVFYRCNKLSSIKFEEPNGWWYADSASATSGTSLDLSNEEENVTYLKTTYLSKYWKKS